MTVPRCPFCVCGYTESWNVDQSGVVITPCDCDAVGREPTDDEIYNRPGVEGGIGYPLGAGS